MDSDEYRRFEKACVAELEAKQEKIAEIALRFTPQIDLEKGKIRFLHEGELFLEAAAIPIGSWGSQSKTWMWAWANSSIDAGVRNESAGLQQVQLTTGNDEFLSKTAVPADEPKAWGFTAIACQQLGGIGAFMEPFDHSQWFFAIRELTHFKAPEVLLRRAQSVAEHYLKGGGSENQDQVDSGDLGVPVPIELRPRTMSLEARALNALRRRFPEVRFHVLGADLRGKALPWEYDLHMQQTVDWGYLSTHKWRNLAGANLSHSRFDQTIMRDLTLCDASFEDCSLVGADLSGADLRGASFRNAFLNGVNFTRSGLTGADFTGAELSRTLLVDVDISEVRGLDEVHHMASSEISFSTLVASDFKIAPTFLRAAGVSRGLIQDLKKGQRFPGGYETCFLSYSSKDGEFARKLYRSLSKSGIRVFWDQFDVIAGEYLEAQISEAIREHNRLLLVLSRNSMASDWVKREVELAWFRKKDSLLPIRLCPMDDIKQWTQGIDGLPDLASIFHIPDFSEWKVRASYDHELALLVKSLSGGVQALRASSGRSHRRATHSKPRTPG